MRNLALLFSILVLCTSLGCREILAELDSASEMVGTKEKKKEEIAKAEEPEAKKGIDWTVSKSINTGQVDSSIVRCKLGGSTQFMKRDDCVTRGGKPGSV